MSNVTIVPIEIVDKATGHVSIMHFVTEERDGTTGKAQWNREATTENIEAELVKSGQTLSAITWRQIMLADLLTNRLFRNAWRSDGRKVSVDMPAARELHMVDVRRARDIRLKEKDGEWMREFSRGNRAAADAVETERQKLRDAPQTIDADVKAAKMPEELKAIWPAPLV